MNAIFIRSKLAVLLILAFVAWPLLAQEADDPTDTPTPATEEQISEPATDPAAEEADPSSTGEVSDSEPGNKVSPSEQKPVVPPAAESTILLPAPRKSTIEPATFRDIKPGQSTTKDLAEFWGPPKEIRKIRGVRTQVYQIEQFPRVTVRLDEDVVASIVINLDKPVGTEELARQLDLDDISSVQVTDDKGQLLGESFPERGVMFGYPPGGEASQVSQVVLETLDPQPFLLRAEMYLRGDFAKCLTDANSALEVDSLSAHAHGMRARVYRQAGDLKAAIKAAETASSIEPDEAQWRLILAKVLIQTTDYPRARQQLQQVLDNQSADALAQARAHILLGDCLALAPGEETATAIQEHLKAIKLAEKLATDSQLTVRRSAKEVLMDAHLRVAHDIGWGRWQGKAKAMVMWIDRATNLAQDLVDHEQGDKELMLRVREQALAAFAGVADPPDVSSGVEATIKQAKVFIEKSTDPARTAQLQWQLGLALCDAVQIEQARGKHEHAIQHGRLAAEYLECGEAAGRQLPNHDYLVGQLYYRIGAIHALGKQDHKQAIQWYDLAVKLLEAPFPPSQLDNSGRQGETFVSIAVSYWESGNRQEAMRLTKQGSKLMEQAVEDGLLSKAALAVPYGNLSSMHNELGDKKLASEFADLAAKCEVVERSHSSR